MWSMICEILAGRRLETPLWLGIMVHVDVWHLAQKKGRNGWNQKHTCWFRGGERERERDHYRVAHSETVSTAINKIGVVIKIEIIIISDLHWDFSWLHQQAFQNRLRQCRQHTLAYYTCEQWSVIHSHEAQLRGPRIDPWGTSTKIDLASEIAPWKFPETQHPEF